MTRKIHQAEMSLEIPDVEEKHNPLYIVTATWTGRGPMHGARKIFTRQHLTSASAEKHARSLKPEYKKRRIYKLQ